MFKITLTARADGAVHEFEADSGDLYVWEKTHRGKTLGTLDEHSSMVDFYEIAQIAARRHGVFTGSVDELAETHALKADSLDEPDPTQSGASDEPSSGSRSNRASRRTSGRSKATGRS